MQVDVCNYSKFKLKSEDELTRLLQEKLSSVSNLAVLACNKCFKAYRADSAPEPELEDFITLAEKCGKNVSDSMRLDFLCNEHRLREKITGVPHPDAFIIISCGIGMQTASEIIYEHSRDIPAYTACDSIETGGSHGMALSDKQCDACGQCFLNKTGGSCPITGCPKHLLNGPCGGAKNGKCEADDRNDCVWYNALKMSSISSRAGSYEHNRRIRCNINGLTLSDLTRYIREKRSMSFEGGLYLRYCKDCTAFLTLQDFPLHPTKVVIPMSQHAGMSAEPIVCVGERVLVGQKIGEAVGALSSSVHASVSGIVSAIDYQGHPNIKQDSLCITIESDGKDELHRSVSPIPYWDDLDILDIEAIIAEKGIVGMGGACFPTPVKLMAPKPIDTILLNGCESEPFITADHRIMLEKADEIITGLRIILKCTEAKRAIIVISDNKSDAITHLEAKTSEFDDIFVMALWSKYPQGAERMLIARALGRQLDYGQRPYDVGATVLNVSTARAIGDAFIRGMPLIERAVTVSGDKIMRPGNFIVRIGTPAADILDYCGLVDGHTSVLFGGPMMGVTLTDYNSPVIKGTNAIIAKDVLLSCSSDCIKCGRCVDVCPMELLPLHFSMLSERDLHSISVKSDMDARNCIECGACDYICPSGIEIRKAIRKCKAKLSKNP